MHMEHFNSELPARATVYMTQQLADKALLAQMQVAHRCSCKKVR